VADVAKLDVSGASLEQKKEILKYATETRRFEIERFWQRSLFFWGFIGAAFVAYAALAKDNVDPLLSLSIACFGGVSSVAWTLQNRGSKYWQEAWEDKIRAVEIDVLGVPLFSNIEPVRNRHIWGALRYSVSKLAIALSDFTAIVWGFLVWKSHPRQYFHTDLDLPDWIALVAASYLILILAVGRAKKKRP
jgi:hypothetical protein